MILCAGPLCVACCVVLITRNWGKKKVKKNCQLSSSFFLWTLYCNIIILALTPYYEMASAFFEINCFTYRHYCCIFQYIRQVFLQNSISCPILALWHPIFSFDEFMPYFKTKRKFVLLESNRLGQKNSSQKKSAIR